MDSPHPGTNFPEEYKPQLPPAGFQEPPGQPGYPGPPGGYLGPQAGYSGPNSPYPGPFPGPPIPPGSSAGAAPPGFPIQNQPGYGPAAVPWMPAPPVPLNCPPGLEYLSQIDQILVHQQIELLEVLAGIETNNKYEIKNSLGQRVYFAAEDNDFYTLNFGGPSRPFTLRILDNMGREVVTMVRPLRCDCCCCPCCLQEIEIQAPPGVPVGYVSQKWHPCLPKFTVQNERREDVLKISGPCITCSCSSDIDFEIKSLDEQSVVGKISRQWGGMVRAAFTDADNFGIQFPLDLDVKMKTVMLGACFLIDFMFFETAPNQNQRQGV